MLRRLLIWVVAPILGLIWLVALLVVIALRTDPGRNALLGYALPELEAATGLKVQYKDVGGPWPNRIIFHGLVLSDDQGVWLTADYFAFDWSPLRLLRGQIMMPRAQIDNGYLRREPVIRESGSTTPGKGGGTPYIRIRTLVAKRLHLGPDLFDQELMLDLLGRFTLENGHDMKVDLNADVDTPADFSTHLRALFGTGLKVQANVEGNVHQSLAISGLKAVTRDQRLALAGAGDYVIHTHVLDATITGTAAPELAAWITSDLKTKSPFALKAHLFGPFKEQGIKADIAFKDASYAGTMLPPFVASGDVVRTPAEIAGPVSILFMDEKNRPAGKAAARLDYAMSGRVRLNDFTLDYRGTSIKGALDLETDPDTKGVATFNAVIPEASILPIDLGLKGDIKGNGAVRFDKSATSIDAQIHSDHLNASGVDIKALAAKLKGPFSSLTVDAAAQSVTPPAVGALDNVGVVVTLGLNKDTTIRISKLTSGYADHKLVLGAPAALTIAQDRLALDKLDISWGEDGRFTGMAERNGENLRLLLKIAKFTPPQGPARIDGVIDVDTRRATPGTINLSFVPASELKAKVKMDLTGKWDKKRLALLASFQGIAEDAGFKKVAPLTFSMPLALKPGKGLSVSTDGPIDGRIAYGGTIAPFVGLVPMPQQTLTGTATINVAVSGTLDNPVFAGSASLRDAKYQHVGRGVVLDEINLNGHVAHSAAGYVFTADLSASDGRKHTAGDVPIKAKSEMSLGKSATKLQASLDLQHAQLVHLATTTGVASGHLDIAGTMPKLSTTGTLNFESIDVNIPDAMPADIVQIKVVPVDVQGNPLSPEVLQPVEKNPLVISLDCAVKAAGNINIRGRGLDSEWGANLHVGGTADAPQISGTMNLVRGRFDFSGRRFQLTRGTVGFSPNNSFDPTLSVVAQYTDKASNLDMINVNGPASQPKITLTSDPPQAQEDVMSMVLFGKQAKELSAFEAVQTANAVSKLTGKGLPGMGGVGILDRARSTLGLDLLNFSLGAQGSVSVGKYIQKNIYVEATQGLAGQPGTVSVNVDISKQLSVKTNVGQDSTGGAGIFWKKDY